MQPDTHTSPQQPTAAPVAPQPAATQTVVSTPTVQMGEIATSQPASETATFLSTVNQAAQAPAQANSPITASTANMAQTTQQVAQTHPIPTVAEISASPAITNQVYSDICTYIIREQQNIIGSLAIDQAELVDGLTVHRTANGLLCQVTGDGLQVIDQLISQYQDFFGHAAVEVCKEAASQLLVKLPPTQIPASLR